MFQDTRLKLSEIKCHTKHELVNNCGEFSENASKQMEASVKDALVGNLVLVVLKNRITRSPYRISWLDVEGKENSKRTKFECVLYPSLDKPQPILIDDGEEIHWEDYSPDRKVVTAYKVNRRKTEDELIDIMKNDTSIHNSTENATPVEIRDFRFVPDKVLAKTHPTKETIQYVI